MKRAKCFTWKGNKDPRVSSHGTFVNKPDPIFDKPGFVPLVLNRVEAGGQHWITHERIVQEVSIHFKKHVLRSHQTVWDWTGFRNQVRLVYFALKKINIYHIVYQLVVLVSLLVSKMKKQNGRERVGLTRFNASFCTIIIRTGSQETHCPSIGTCLQLFGSKRVTSNKTFPPFFQQQVACVITYPLKILSKFVLQGHPLSTSCLSTLERTRVKNIIDIRQIVHTYC